VQCSSSSNNGGVGDAAGKPPSAVAVELLCRMAAVASWSQLQELLLLLLLQIATSRWHKHSTAEGAALALSSIRSTRHYIGERSRHYVHLILAQPCSQELLQVALRSSSCVIRDAAADVLAGLLSKVSAEPDAVAAVPSYAQALRQAVHEVRHGSSCAAAVAAQLCWLASKQWPAADLLFPLAGGLLPAATGRLCNHQGFCCICCREPMLHPSQIYTLAVLFNITAEVPAFELLEQQQQLVLPPLLLLWLDGEAPEEFPDISTGLLYQAERVMRGMLGAFSSFGDDCRLAAAVRDALQHACRRSFCIMVCNVMFVMHNHTLLDDPSSEDESEDEDGQSAPGSPTGGAAAAPAAATAAAQAATEAAKAAEAAEAAATSSATGKEATGQSKEQQQSAQEHKQQQQQAPVLARWRLTQLLLGCAPNPCAFLREVQCKPRYWGAFCGERSEGASRSFCGVWCKLLKATPDDVFEEAVTIQLKILGSSSSSCMCSPRGSSIDLADRQGAADAAATTAAAAAAGTSAPEAADVDACSIWCWSCHGTGRYAAAADAAATRDAGKQAAADALAWMHRTLHVNGIYTKVLAQQGNLQQLLQLLHSEDESATDVAGQLLLRVWQLPKQQYEQQQAQELTAALQQLVQTALANDAQAMRAISNMCSSVNCLDFFRIVRSR
jgi:hypothetical protein